VIRCVVCDGEWGDAGRELRAILCQRCRARFEAGLIVVDSRPVVPAPAGALVGAAPPRGEGVSSEAAPERGTSGGVDTPAECGRLAPERAHVGGSEVASG
jgi:hypothetical protein